jgi:hypothetical protein
VVSIALHLFCCCILEADKIDYFFKKNLPDECKLNYVSRFSKEHKFVYVHRFSDES